MCHSCLTKRTDYRCKKKCEMDADDLMMTARIDAMRGQKDFVEEETSRFEILTESRFFSVRCV